MPASVRALPAGSREWIAPSSVANQRLLTLALAGASLAASVFMSHRAHASAWQVCSSVLPCRYEVVQQLSTTSSGEPSGITPSGSNDSEEPLADQKAIERLQASVANYRAKVASLRQTNHGWNIFFITTGVSMTLLATSLGAVGSASDKARARTTITIAVIGAVAVAAQTIASRIPVAKRAGEYAKIQSALATLEYKVQDVRTKRDLALAQTDFYDQIAKMGDVEAAE
jgi:hypothetical protein